MISRNSIGETCPAKAVSQGPVRLGTCVARWVLLGFGFFNVALGIIGAFMPGMPTTVFLIIALWAFSKSSERFRYWLWNHKRFGQPLRAWHEHKVIPPKAKAMAVSMMALSIVIITMVFAGNWVAPLAMTAVMTPIAAYILTRRAYVPSQADVVHS